jgi:hypothetical protein
MKVTVGKTGHWITGSGKPRYAQKWISCKNLSTVTSKNEVIRENMELTQFYKDWKTL